MSNRDIEVKPSGTADKASVVPALRFPEFRDASGWELRTLGSVLDYERPDKYIVHDEDYQASGVPVLTANKSFILGYTDETDGVYGTPPAIIFDDFTVDMKFVTFPFKVKSSAIKILTIKGSHELKLVYELMQQIDFNAREHKRYWISEYQYLEVPLPDEYEQQRISDCLSSVDQLIAAETRKLDAFRNHKKSLMRQIFPIEGETIPRARFKKFQGAHAWRCAPIGEIFETTSGGTPDRSKKEYWSGDIPWVPTALVNFNHIEKAQEFVTEEGLKNSSAKMFPLGTILIAMYGQGKTRGKVAILDIAATTNQACAAILPQEGIDPEFVFLTLSNRYEELRALSNSGGQENLSQTLIRGFSVSIPWDIEEQMKIKSCLSRLNELIAEQAHRIEALTQHKVGLMQQLFPIMTIVEER